MDQNNHHHHHQHHQHHNNDEDLNELLSLKKIKLTEDETDQHQPSQHHHPSNNVDIVDESMEMSSTNDEDELISKEHLINMLRSYMNAKKRVEFVANEDKVEEAQMLSSIKSMLRGSRRFHSNTTSTEDENGGETEEDDEDGLVEQGDELPDNLIVTGLPNEFFGAGSGELKKEFEAMFTRIESACRFSYFRLFKRCCIQFNDPIAAILARFELDEIMFLNTQLKLYLNKPIKLKNSRAFLEPPKNEKTFLISPPSSPPVGWEQNLEDPPVVNLDLLVALSKLNPHEPCELIKSQENMPGIIVHPCPDIYIEDGTATPGHAKTCRIIPTRRPPDYMN